MTCAELTRSRPSLPAEYGGRKPAAGGVPLALLLLIAALIAPGRALADPGEIAWERRIQVASGNAHRGPWRMNESEFDYVDDPTVAIDDRGMVGIAWADQPKKDIFFQVYQPGGGTGLEEPVNVSRSPLTFSWLPRMLLDSETGRDVFVLWQEIIFSGGSHGGEVLFARSSDGGRSFSAPLNLSNTTAGAGKGRLDRDRWDNGSLDLAIGPGGVLYAAWTEYEGSLKVSRSADRGVSFSEPLHVAGGASAPARGPSLAVDSHGTVYLAWTVGEDASADIHLARSTDRGGSFDEPRRIIESGGHSDAPKIAVDPEGAVHLVFAESPVGPFQRYHVRHTRSLDGGRTFDPPRDISTPAVGASESMNFPHLGSDGRSNLYVVWELYPSARGRSQGLGFARSKDGGRTFGPPSVIPGTVDPALGFNGSQQGLLMRKLAVNGSGSLAVVNSTFDRGEASHVWLHRGGAAAR